MSERDLGTVGGSDMPTGGSLDDEAAGIAENTSTTTADRASGAGADERSRTSDRSDRGPGETESGDDDWGSPAGGQALGPADAPTGTTDPGGS